MVEEYLIVQSKKYNLLLSTGPGEEYNNLRGGFSSFERDLIDGPHEVFLEWTIVLGRGQLQLVVRLKTINII